MVNMVGFHHREPTFNTASMGEPGFFLRIQPMPTADHPQRAKVTFPTGHAVFRSPDHTAPWLNPESHSEEIVAAAHYYRLVMSDVVLSPGQQATS